MSADRRTYTWKQALRSVEFVVQLVITAAGLVGLGLYIDRFFNYIQSKPGDRWEDVVLETIPAYDVSWVIFVLIYSAVALSLVHVARFPWLLLKTAEAYIILVLLRAIFILVFPLDPPDNMVPLRDPFVEMFFYSDQVITKDLMFSGHVSLLVLLTVASTNFNIRMVLCAISLIVAVLLLVQHAHYTMDVIVGAAIGAIVMRQTKKTL